VSSFLDTVVADFEDVVRENAQLRRESERLARELDAYRSREKTIQDTLTTAQTLVEQLKRTAIKESEPIVIDAQLRAEKLLADARGERVVAEARGQRAAVANEIREQRHLRQRLEADLRRTLESYGKLIDAMGSSDRPDGE